MTSLMTNSQIVMRAVTSFQKVSSRPPFIYHPDILKIRYVSPKGYISGAIVVSATRHVFKSA